MAIGTLKFSLRAQSDYSVVQLYETELQYF